MKAHKVSLTATTGLLQGGEWPLLTPSCPVGFSWKNLFRPPPPQPLAWGFDLSWSCLGPWNLFHSFIHSFIRHQVKIKLGPATSWASCLICNLRPRGPCLSCGRRPRQGSPSQAGSAVFLCLFHCRPVLPLGASGGALMRERREERIATRIPWCRCAWFTLYRGVQRLRAVGPCVGAEGLGGRGRGREAVEVETHKGFCLPWDR